MLKLKIVMTKPAQYGKPLIATATEIVRFSALFLVTGMTLYGVSLSQAVAQSSPNELSSVSTPAISDAPGARSLDASPLEMPGKPVEAISESNTIFFSMGSLVIGDDEKEKLRQHGAYLKGNPKKTVTLVGNAEPQGSRTYGLADVEARLAAVSKWLRVYGASLRQIQRNLVDSVKRSPTCRSADCRPQPRRVELEYSP